MKNIFNSVKFMKPKSNPFDLTHDVKMSGKMGNLMPVLALEAVPGDRVELGADTLIRFAPLIAPVMHRMNATIHYFFVPNRLSWENWEKFIVNEATGGVPTIQIDGTLTAAENRFIDYMGVPPFIGSVAQPISALPFAAYQRIYNEYYRDQNLITEVDADLIDGDNSANTDLLVMRKRAWMHDYFTAALPFAQKGGVVDLPIGDITLNPDWNADGQIPRLRDLNMGIAPEGALSSSLSAGTETISVGIGASTAPPDIHTPNIPVAYDPEGSLEVGATTISTLRRAFKLQEWLEKNARGGTRYIENILAHFGVRSSDKRLQRPEYITGVKSPVIISEVLNTTGESGGLPQGNMAGHAVSVGRGKVGSYSVEEHGWIIGICSIMPIPAYQQGIPKSFLKTDPLEYYWPSFAHIGEQEILNKEIFAYGVTGSAVFGYIPRYAEYKYMPSRVAGDFRTTLDYWHLGRIFASQPALTQEFIEMAEAEAERIFAVGGGEDNLYMHILNQIKARRPMPVFGTPML